MSDLELIVKIAGVVIGIIGIGDKVYTYVQKWREVRRQSRACSLSVTQHSRS